MSNSVSDTMDEFVTVSKTKDKRKRKNRDSVNSLDLTVNDTTVVKKRTNGDNSHSQNKPLNGIEKNRLQLPQSQGKSQSSEYNFLGDNHWESRNQQNCNDSVKKQDLPAEKQKQKNRNQQKGHQDLKLQINQEHKQSTQEDFKHLHQSIHCQQEKKSVKAKRGFHNQNMTSKIAIDSEKPHIAPLTDQEKELAQNAMSEYDRRNMEGCLQYMSKLESARPSDPHVLINKALAEYAVSEYCATEKFGDELQRICSQNRIKLDNIESMEDADQCVVYYNYAVVLYHKREYWQALKILAKLLTNLEPMDELLAEKVCLLAVDVNLHMYQPEKALVMIEYIENHMLSTDTKGMMSNDKDRKDKQSATPSPQEKKLEGFALKLRLYKIICYIVIQSQKPAKREAKSMNMGTDLNITALYLKANFDYTRKNYLKALSQLNTVWQQSISYRDTGINKDVFYYNNAACIYVSLSKPTLACIFLQRALDANEESRKALGDNMPLHVLGSTYRNEILYNTGIALMLVNKPDKAFECFMHALQAFHANPRLWVRLAECCIMVNSDSSKEQKIEIKHLVQGTVGLGSHRKIVLTPGLSNQNKYFSGYVSSAIPSTTLEFAALCLQNALRILPDNLTDMSSEERSKIFRGSDFCTSAPSNPFRYEELVSLKQTVLTDGAYVSLCLGDYVVALNYAQSLLAQKKLSAQQQLLGSLYAAEANIMLNRVDKAIDILQDHVTELSSDFQPSEKAAVEKSLEGWFPNNVETAKVVLMYNLTVAFAMKGDLQKASELLKQIWQSQTANASYPVHVIMLVLYIQLLLGHADTARSIIKRHCPQYR